jgi:hypothetical protein
MSVTIFGILNIGFAALGLVGLLFSAVILSHTDAAKNPMLKEMYDNPAYAAWMKISMPLSGIVSVVLLAAGIGLLLLKNWARIASIAYGIYAILGCLVGGVLMLNVIVPIISHNSGGPERMIMIFTMIGSVGGMVLGLVYPILLIIFMTRPKIIAAFGPPPPVA